jgi:hypothetical protein
MVKAKLFPNELSTCVCKQRHQVSTSYKKPALASLFSAPLARTRLLRKHTGAARQPFQGRTFKPIHTAIHLLQGSPESDGETSQIELEAHLSSKMHNCVHLFGDKKMSNKVCGLYVALNELHFPQTSADISRSEYFLQYLELQTLKR